MSNQQEMQAYNVKGEQPNYDYPPPPNPMADINPQQQQANLQPYQVPPLIKNNYQQQQNNNQKDYEKQFIGGSSQPGGLLENSRLGFIRKVYLILLAQLLLTVLFCGIAMSSEKVREFQRQNIWLFILCLVASFTCQIAIFCFPKNATKVPTNYILCGIFTFSFAWMISMICGQYAEEPKGYQTVFIAAGMTAGMVLGLTIYALTTKQDFTTKGGMLCVACLSFLFFGIFLGIFNQREVGWVNIMYCCIGVILFGFYLVYDTQIIAGGKHRKFQLDYDQYIIGAMILYIDIIYIFLYLLEIIGSSR